MRVLEVKEVDNFLFLFFSIVENTIRNILLKYVTNISRIVSQLRSYEFRIELSRPKKGLSSVSKIHHI